jgi:hypothetical protein
MDFLSVFDGLENRRPSRHDGGEKKRAHRREAFLHSGGVLVRNQAFRFNAIVLGIVLLQTSTRTMKGALGA